jgi:hypothetical protein
MQQIAGEQGAAVGNHIQNGGRNVALPEENQPSWRPEDDRPRARFRDDDDRDYRGWRDARDRDDDRATVEHLPHERDWRAMRSGERGDRAFDSAERPIERWGQGQSGYGAGRYGDDRLRQLGRHESGPSAGSFEERTRESGMAVDDRWTGRGRSGYGQERTGYEERYGHGSYRGRDFEPERHGLSRPHRDDERLGYPAGSYGRAYGGSGADEGTRRDVGSESHVHRGTGPHRGKGPVGYQRSDERIREMVCESLSDDDQLDASHIEVTVNHGEVTLSGTVDDRRAKRDAEDCACSVSGVRDVQNVLRVKDDRARSNLSGQTSVGRNETETPAQDKKHRA